MSVYSALVLASNPNAYWRLGEASGTVANSEVNAGTMAGAYTSGATPGAAGLLSGDVDTAATFVAASGQFVVANPNAHKTAQDVADVFTIEAWIKRSSVGAGSHASIFANGAGSIDFRINATDDKLHLASATVADICDSTVAIADLQRHHVVATKNGATTVLYIDGVDRTGTVANTTFTNSTTAWVIGGDLNALNNFNGVLDEVALYPTALSAATVLSHYQTGFGIAAAFLPQAARIRYT